jgi:hypothetical protein
MRFINDHPPLIFNKEKKKDIVNGDTCHHSTCYSFLLRTVFMYLHTATITTKNYPHISVYSRMGQTCYYWEEENAKRF